MKYSQKRSNRNQHQPQIESQLGTLFIENRNIIVALEIEIKGQIDIQTDSKSNMIASNAPGHR